MAMGVILAEEPSGSYLLSWRHEAGLMPQRVKKQQPLMLVKKRVIIPEFGQCLHFSLVLRHNCAKALVLMTHQNRRWALVWRDLRKFSYCSGCSKAC